MNSDKLDSIVEDMITSIQLLKDEIIQLEKENDIADDILNNYSDALNTYKKEIERLNDIIREMKK